MKKKTILSRTALAAGVLSLSLSASVFAAAVTEESARSIALEHAGQKAEDVTFVKLKSDLENNRRIFEVKFLTADYREYEYEILESDGTILSVDYEHLSSPSQETTKTTVSLEQAKASALEHAGQLAENVTFVKEETDCEHGLVIYETEFHTSDGKKYKYELDGNTGDIVSWEYDAWGCLLAKKHVQGPGGMNTAASPKADAISGVEGAKAAALEKAGLKGASVTWKKLERDREDGHLVYEGEFVHGSMEYEFEIDAATGVFLDWEVESIYD